MMSHALLILLGLALWPVVSADLSHAVSQAARGQDVQGPHGPICTDISTYGPWTQNCTNVTCCEHKKKKMCTPKTETVQVNITEISCKAVAWADCKMDWKTVDANVCEQQNHFVPGRKCIERNVTIPHTKSKPICKNVTYDNCVSKWIIDENGQKVLSEKEDCTPVVWKNCTLVNETVNFTHQKTDCYELGEGRNYTRPVPVPHPITVDQSNCVVKTAVDCEPVTKTVWVAANWQECQDVKDETCNEYPVCVPSQEKIHKFKCLSKQDHHHD